MPRAPRATDLRQKARRRALLLDAARERLRSAGWGGLTMEQVAGEAGVAKGTVYLSFPTKEALFLALLDEEFAAWFDATAAALTSLRVPTIDRVAGVVAEETAGRATFRRLLGLMHEVLEQNIPREEAAAFKRSLLRRFNGLAGVLGGLLPGLGPSRAGCFLLRTHALAVGLQGMADPAPVLGEIMRGPEWAPLRVDFENDLRCALRDILRGMTGEK